LRYAVALCDVARARLLRSSSRRSSDSVQPCSCGNLRASLAKDAPSDRDCGCLAEITERRHNNGVAIAADLNRSHIRAPISQARVAFVRVEIAGARAITPSR
jgi:hypothetical protein